MGASSNLEVFLSEKHLINDRMVRPTKETQDEEEDRSKQQLLVQERQQEQQQCHEDHERASLDLTRLRLEIPSSYKEKDEEDSSNYEGCKTPTSPESTIPTILQCPPAPKKPKPTRSLKRKDCRPRIVVDLSREFESLFPTPFNVDLGAGGRKNKKFKPFNNAPS